MEKIRNLKPSEKKAKLNIPSNFWYMIEDGAKTSPLIFSLTCAYEYVMDHDFSPCAVIYWGILQPSQKPCHKSQKDFVSRGGMFVFDFIEVCAYG